MITPEMRAAVVAGLLELRAFWPALPDNEHTVRALTEELEGFTPEEIAAAFRTVRSEHQQASAPKPWHLKQAAAQAARRLRWRTLPPNDASDGPPVFCPVCHTPDLYETLAGRFRPAHRQGCGLLMQGDYLEMGQAQQRNGMWYGGKSPAEQERQRITSVRATLAAPEPAPVGGLS